MPEMEEVAGVDLIDIHATRESAQPHIPHIVFISGVDGIIAKAGGIDVVMKVMLEGVGMGIIDIDAGVFQADPEFVLEIFPHAIYDVTGEAFCIAWFMIEVLKSALRAGIIHTVQTTAICTDP